MRKIGIASRVDDSGASIGKKYARNDELGTPFGCTVDFASLKNGTMTLRYVYSFSLDGVLSGADHSASHGWMRSWETGLQGSRSYTPCRTIS